MEPDVAAPASPVQAAPAPATCPVCHQGVKPEYYFCPNCGANLHPAPLSTSLATQTWIYAFSLVLPMFLYIGITKWPAMKYLRSEDPRAKQIGMSAIVLLILSTLVGIWLAYVWTQEAIQSSIDSINADMSI